MDYNNSQSRDRQSSTNQDDLISIIGSDLENNENHYNGEILRQLFLDFQVESEEGRWVDPEFKDEEDMTIEVEAGTGTEEEVSVVEMEDTGEVGNNGAIREN